MDKGIDDEIDIEYITNLFGLKRTALYAWKGFVIPTPACQIPFYNMAALKVSAFAKVINPGSPPCFYACIESIDDGSLSMWGQTGANIAQQLSTFAELINDYAPFCPSREVLDEFGRDNNIYLNW